MFCNWSGLILAKFMNNAGEDVMNNFKLENELLISLARTQLSDKEKSSIKDLLEAPLDWDYILEAAMCNRIAALLYHHLREFNNLVPTEINEQFAKSAHTAGFYNLCFYQRLEEIIHEFDKAGIDVIIVKGGLWAEQFYKNIALRSMSDIDLLIRKEDFLKANHLLNSLGFKHEKEKFSLGWSLGSISHIKSGLGLKIDLHWSLTKTNSPFSIKMEEVWNRRKKVIIADISTYTLCVEDMILFFCLHTLYNHYLNIGLQAFCDLAEIVKHNKDNINWHNLDKLAAKYKLSFIVYAGLWLTKSIIFDIIPLDVLDLFRVHCSRSQLKWLGRVKDKMLIADGSKVVETLIRLRMITDLKTKLGLLRLIFFPPSWELVLYYPFSEDNKLAYLYYLLPNLKNCLSKIFLKFNSISG